MYTSIKKEYVPTADNSYSDMKNDNSHVNGQRVDFLVLPLQCTSIITVLFQSEQQIYIKQRQFHGRNRKTMRLTDMNCHKVKRKKARQSHTKSENNK